MFQRITVLGAAAMVLLCAVNVPCQRGVKKISKTSSEPHSRAQISPDGKLVAFFGKGQARIGVVDTGGNTENTLASGSSLGNFVWAPNSSGIYYLDGVEVKFVPKSGGRSTSIGTGSGLMFLSCVDRGDKEIYGYRRDKNNLWYVFSLATGGSGSPKDLVSIKANYWVDNVCVDFSGKKLAYFVSLQGTFKPKDLRVADAADGKNEVSWSNGAKLHSATGSLGWADAGQTVVFTSPVSKMTTTWQIGRLTAASSTVEYLTSGPKNHLQSSTGLNLSWIVFQAEAQGFRLVPGVIPAQGGGRVLLEPEENWIFLGLGAPTIDAAGQKVAFAASFLDKNNNTTIPQIYLVELDREIVVKPQPKPGANIDITLPVDKGERGMLFLSVALLPKPIELPGYTYGVAINTNAMIGLLNGVGDGQQPLQLKGLPIPNQASLKGFEVYLQGIRSSAANSGEFTRYVELQIQ